MAFAHISYNKNSQYGQKLFALLTKLETGDDEFADVRDVMVQMRDGDGSQNVHYAEVIGGLALVDYDSTQGATHGRSRTQRQERLLKNSILRTPRQAVMDRSPTSGPPGINCLPSCVASQSQDLI